MTTSRYSTSKTSSSRARSLNDSATERHAKSDSLCVSCGKGDAEVRYVTRSFGRGASLLVIENIPLWTCPHCGESYFSAETMHEIERIKTLRKSVAVDRVVSVAEFMSKVPNKSLRTASGRR